MAGTSTLSAPFRRLAARRQHAAEEAAISFPELAWAHFLRQKEVEEGHLNGPADAEYRRRLATFEAAEGKVIKAYWCTTEASGVALTAKPKGVGHEVRFHAATDWVARSSPDIANILHLCEAMAVRIGEVLGGASERVGMQWLLAVAGHVLGYVDGEHSGESPKAAARLVGRKQRELETIEGYYLRAGDRLGRIVYFWGMMVGVLVTAAAGAAVCGLLWWSESASDETLQNVVVSYTMGALGALVSVMTRMASSRRDAFSLDFEVGRLQIYSLGSLRPLTGAIFGLVLFFLVKSDLLQVVPDEQQTTYFYSVIAFLAGFSERWARVTLGRAEALIGGQSNGEQPAAKEQPTERNGSV